jgi:hypothetical protein
MRFLALALLMLVTFAAAPAYAEPEKVSVGVYVADIQEIDMKSHSYRLDIYMWFRWKDPRFDPSKSAEFINMFDPADHVRTSLYDEPQKMPDGTYYAIIRDQGKFSSKFDLQSYPFDYQELPIIIEDNVHEADELVYVPDTSTGAAITLNPEIYLPGFDIWDGVLEVTNFNYPTNFGDLRSAEKPDYSRATFSIPAERPWLGTGLKIFLPVLLILLCTALVLNIHPSYIEGRLGVVITALLTLVALQLTSASGLPEVDYMLMTDKIYLLSYLFIIATLIQVVRHSRAVHEKSFDAIAQQDIRMRNIFTAAMFVGLIIVIITTLI